jgi:hypothetical protein
MYARLKISGVASHFATQISGIAIQSPHLICNLLHKITHKLIRNVKNCCAKLFFSIALSEKFRKTLHIGKKLFWALVCVQAFHYNRIYHLEQKENGLYFIIFNSIPSNKLSVVNHSFMRWKVSTFLLEPEHFFSLEWGC